MRLQRSFSQLALRLRSVFRRRSVEQDLDDELRYHVEELTARNLAAGMSPADARARALQLMQGLEQKKEECRDARGVRWIENLMRDISYGLRMLRKSPAFTTVAILSLALGIGANTAIFSLINTLLLRPLPVPHPEQLRAVHLNINGNPQYDVTYPIFQTLQAHNQAFSGLFTWSGHRFQMKSGAETVHVEGALATGDYFSTLGVMPIAGRMFSSLDDHIAGGLDGPVAVISERFWERQFQRSPQAVGSGLTLDRIRFTVIGVMPDGFTGAEVGSRPDIWVPLTMASRVDDPNCITSRSCWWLVTMGRLRDGVTAEQADAAVKISGPAILRESVPDWGEAQKKRFLSWGFGTSSGEQGWSALRLQFKNPLAILMTLVGLVLLIACTNMANLLLARSAARHREIGVRLAIGAGRGRVIRQLLTESALLSLLGGVGGSLFSIWLTRFLASYLETSGQFGPNQSINLDLNPDWRVVLFTLVISVGTGTLFGLAPAFRATRVGIGAALKEAANNIRGLRRISLGRATLALQAGLSVLLVAAAGLFAGSLYQLLNLNIGFNPKNVITVAVDTDKRPEKEAALSALYGRILERVNRLPGVTAATLMYVVPLGNGGWDDALEIPGRHDLAEEQRDTYINVVSPHFFNTMEIPLLVGRPFSERDTPKSEKVGIINQLAARRFFPDTNPVGMQIPFAGSMMRIVGIAGDIKYLDLRRPEPPELYIPFTQKPNSTPSYTFALKTTLSTDLAVSEFRTALRQVAPDVPIGRVKTMRDQVSDCAGRERLMATLSIFFGLLALLLTAIGLYGVLAYSVARRTGEIGIRMALGAQRRSVVWLVLSGTARYVGLGISVGVIAAVGMSKLAADLLYGIQPNDPINLAVAVVALLGVSSIAASAPAVRAARLDPTRALREE